MEVAGTIRYAPHSNKHEQRLRVRPAQEAVGEPTCPKQKLISKGGERRVEPWKSSVKSSNFLQLDREPMKVSFLERRNAEEEDSHQMTPVVVCLVVQRVKKPKAGRQELLLKEGSHQVSVDQGYFYLTTEYLFVIIILKLWLFLLNLLNLLFSHCVYLLTLLMSVASSGYFYCWISSNLWIQVWSQYSSSIPLIMIIF